MSSLSRGKRLNRDSPFQPRDSALLAGLLSDLDRLLEQQASADVHFMVDHEKVTAHRLIVVARCERYRTKKRFNQQPDNSPLIIQLGKHFSAAAVKDVICYLYTGKVRKESVHSNYYYYVFIAKQTPFAISDIKAICWVWLYVSWHGYSWF